MKNTEYEKRKSIYDLMRISEELRQKAENFASAGKNKTERDIRAGWYIGKHRKEIKEKMKISGELDYRIRYDVEHDLFHAQNVFNDEYITPTFIEYVQKLEKENAELKERFKHRNCLDCSNHHSNIKLFKAKEPRTKGE